MPNKGSFPKTTNDWEGVLAAVEENAALLPDVQAEKTALQAALEKVRSLKDQQTSFRASKQQTTQDLKQALAEGRQLAEKLRDAAKFKIGRRSERLVQFSVSPLRTRPGKKQTPPPVAGQGTAHTPSTPSAPVTTPDHPKP
jgi:hypothetical protein